MSDRSNIDNIQGIFISPDPLPMINGQEEIEHKGLKYYSTLKTKTRLSYVKDRKSPALKDRVAGLAHQLGVDCAVIGESYVDGKGHFWNKVDFHALSVNQHKDEKHASTQANSIYKSIAKLETKRQFNFVLDMFSASLLACQIVIINMLVIGFGADFLIENFGSVLGHTITGLVLVTLITIFVSGLFLYRCYRSQFPLIPRIHLSSL